MIRITTLACVALTHLILLLQLHSITALTASDITSCPKLKPRTTPPSNVRDLRADDIKVFLALGDSITAGFGAKDPPNDTILNIKNLYENRGVSYAAGGDPGEMTLPNLFGYYSINKGASRGDHLLELCHGIVCPPYQYHSEDNLNAGQTGAMAMNLKHELDYLIPTLKSYRGIDLMNDWKFLNLQIGTNDICESCTDHFGLLGADKYEKYVRDALEVIRKEVPKVVVNLLGTFNASELYGVTLNSQYCQLLRGFYHLNLECGCALINGAGASSVRAAMNTFSSELNARLLKIRNDYAANPNDTFGVVYQPLNIVFAGMPIEVISKVDCFHPSRLGHAWTAKFLWSRLFTPLSDRGADLNYDANYPVYCPNETDRIRLD